MCFGTRFGKSLGRRFLWQTHHHRGLCKKQQLLVDFGCPPRRALRNLQAQSRLLLGREEQDVEASFRRIRKIGGHSWGSLGSGIRWGAVLAFSDHAEHTHTHTDSEAPTREALNFTAVALLVEEFKV